MEEECLIMMTWGLYAARCTKGPYLVSTKVVFCKLYVFIFYFYRSYIELATVKCGGGGYIA